MPMYEYVCVNKKCKTVYTELAKFEDVVACPKCGKPGAKQVATTYRPAFIHRQGKFTDRRKLSITGKKKK